MRGRQPQGGKPQRSKSCQYGLHGCLHEECESHGHDPDGANFTDAYMKGADFSDAKGVRTKLGARSLADANFSRVTLNFPEATGTSFLRSKWIEAKVEKGDFSSSNFYKANFKGATLVKTDFRATKLRGASWKGAKVKGSDFTGAEGNKP